MDLTGSTVNEYKKYLKSQNTSVKTVNEIFRNAIKYYHVLYEGNASELTTFSIGKRKDVMKAWPPSQSFQDVMKYGRA